MKLEIIPQTTSDGRRIWCCSKCRTRAAWGPDWVWLGSYRDGVEKVYCGACRPSGITLLDGPVSPRQGDGTEKA